MSDTEVTVLMPVYNAEKYIRTAMDSILNQTFKDFEFLIVNDGSTDKTEDIINSYLDSRIRLINRENGGVPKALNTGIENAKGKYIARMDADDISHVDRLEKQYQFMKKHPEYILLGSNANQIDEKGCFIFKYEAGHYDDSSIKGRIKEDCLFIHTSVFFLKNAIINEGMYNEFANSFADHILWSKLRSSKGKFFIFKEVLVDYRFSSSSLTIDFKDYSPEFMRVKRKALETGEITEKDEKIITGFLKGLDERKKTISYHRMLAKKYLWNNYQPKKARKNLAIVFKLQPLHLMTIALFSLSFLPKGWILKIYNRGKGA